MKRSRFSGKKKIQAMYEMYGYDKQRRRCEECCNLYKKFAHTTIRRKCKAYGHTDDGNTDWQEYDTACGLFGQPFDGEPLYERLKPKEKTPKDCKGQISML